MEGVAHPNAAVQRERQVFFGCIMGHETENAHLASRKIGQIDRVSRRDLTAFSDSLAEFRHHSIGKIGTANEIPGMLQEMRVSQYFLVAIAVSAEKGPGVSL
jgi:hypothetical protein